MLLISGIIAGLIAGICMALFSEATYRLKIFKNSQVLVDGSFVLDFVKLKRSTAMPYIFGIIVHCVTSAIFGLVYAVLALWLRFDLRFLVALIYYTSILWLAMLFVALPIAGQGLLGRRAGKFTWLEQLVLHIIFGIIFYYALGII